MIRKPFLYSCLAIMLAALVGGCLGGKKEVYAYAPPPRDDENAAWRRIYVSRRPVPPKHYSVPPVPPRDNGFGEFDGRFYEGLDQQPFLPPLPADSSFPGPGDPFGGSGPAPSGLAAPPPAPADVYRSGRTMTPSPTNLRGSGLAGVDAGAHFYPVEQLVYGGGFPDLDRPETYRLMPGDRITVAVKDHPEFSGPLVIQPDGTGLLPNTPDLVRLRGLTADEAAEAIRRALAAYVRGECLVRVQANRASGGYYFVFGDVLQPGRFPMGIEPVRLSEAVLAANWEANPARLDADGDDLGPSFPAASPRGRYFSPRSADLARVMLVTPHRSQPARTIHDVRAALAGMTGDDPLIRPGQIVIVPSLDAARNAGLGLDVPEPLAPGQGFSNANTPARLPRTAPPPARAAVRREPPVSEVEANMKAAVAMSGTASGPDRWNPETDYPYYKDRKQAVPETRPATWNRISKWPEPSPGMLNKWNPETDDPDCEDEMPAMTGRQPVKRTRIEGW